MNMVMQDCVWAVLVDEVDARPADDVEEERRAPPVAAAPAAAPPLPAGVPPVAPVPELAPHWHAWKWPSLPQTCVPGGWPSGQPQFCWDPGTQVTPEPLAEPPFPGPQAPSAANDAARWRAPR